MIFSGTSAQYTQAIATVGLNHVIRVTGTAVGDISVDDLTGVEFLEFSNTTVDVRPRIASITRLGSSETTNASSVDFKVTFTGVTVKR